MFVQYSCGESTNEVSRIRNEIIRFCLDLGKVYPSGIEKDTSDETREYVFDGSSVGYISRTDLRHDVYEQEINGPAPSPLRSSPMTINGIVLLIGKNAGPIKVNATRIQ